MATFHKNNEFDVCVIGAGPAGSVAAALLTKSGFKVILLEKEEFPREKVCGDCITPPGVSNLLEQNLLNPDKNIFYRLTGVTILTSRTPPNLTSFSFKGKYTDYALIAPRKTLDSLLAKKAAEAGALFLPRTEATGVERKDGGFVITATQNNEQVIFKSSSLIVAAGNYLPFLQKTLKLSINDYRACGVAIRAYFKLNHSAGSNMIIVADSDLWPAMGWIFPMKDNLVNAGIGFYLDEKHLVKGTLSQIFKHFIKNSPLTSPILKQAKMLTQPKSKKIFMGGLKKYPAKSGILLCGEAAGLVNPFTGEGIAPAIKSAILAAQTVESFFSSGVKDPELISTAYYQKLMEEFETYMKTALFMKRLATRKFVTHNVLRILNLSPSLSQFNIRYWVKA